MSAAEIDKQNNWYETVIACAMISNDNVNIQQQLNRIVDFHNHYWKELQLMDYSIEVF